MYLQIEFPSVGDQMTRFYCKGNPCCWPVDKNDSAVCFIFAAQFLNVAWPALYLFDRSLSSQLLCPLQKRMAYYSWGSCQRAALPLGMYKSYYQRTDFTEVWPYQFPVTALALDACHVPMRNSSWKGNGGDFFLYPLNDSAGLSGPVFLLSLTL